MNMPHASNSVQPIRVGKVPLTTWWTQPTLYQNREPLISAIRFKTGLRVDFLCYRSIREIEEERGCIFASVND